MWQTISNTRYRHSHVLIRARRVHVGQPFPDSKSLRSAVQRTFLTQSARPLRWRRAPIACRMRSHNWAKPQGQGCDTRWSKIKELSRIERVCISKSPTNDDLTVTLVEFTHKNCPQRHTNHFWPHLAVSTVSRKVWRMTTRGNLKSSSETSFHVWAEIIAGVDAVAPSGCLSRGDDVRDFSVIRKTAVALKASSQGVAFAVHR